MKISVEDWFDYLDGCASKETQQAVEAAVASHPSSRAVYEALRHSDRELRRHARQVHRSFELPHESVAAARANVLNRVKAGAALPADRLARVENLLQPWCGQRVAAGLVLAAVARTSHESTHSLWPSFLDHAVSLTAALCGNAAGQLLAEFGRTVA